MEGDIVQLTPSDKLIHIRVAAVINDSF